MKRWMIRGTEVLEVEVLGDYAHDKDNSIRLMAVLIPGVGPDDVRADSLFDSEEEARAEQEQRAAPVDVEPTKVIGCSMAVQVFRGGEQFSCGFSGALWSDNTFRCDHLTGDVRALFFGVTDEEVLAALRAEIATGALKTVHAAGGGVFRVNEVKRLLFEPTGEIIELNT